MSVAMQPASHLSEGDLVRHLDGELSREEQQALLTHIGGCPACARRLRELQAQAQAVAELITAAPVPDLGELRRARMLTTIRGAERAAASRRMSSGRWPLRAAASIAVLLTAAFTVEPVRAWIGERWQDLAAVVRSEAEPPTTAARAVAEHNPVIAFEPAGERFIVELQHPQRRGTLTLRVEEVQQAVVQVVGEGAAGLLVLPEGIRIENAPGASADYLVTLPPRLRQVEVRLGGGRELSVSLAELPPGESRSYDLASGRLRD